MLTITGIYDMSVPLQGDITNAVVNFSSHDVSLVAVVSNVMRSGKPVVGYGFNSIGRFAQSGLLRHRMIPRVVKAEPTALLATKNPELFCPVAVTETLMRNEKPGGHGDRAGAAAAIELAIWDLNAKILDVPAAQLIAEEVGRDTPAHCVATYAAGGYYYAADSSTRLIEELQQYLDLGFDACKIKIGGASLSEDMARVDAAIKLIGTGNQIAVDANGRFQLNNARLYLEELSAREIRWYEEPGDPLDFDLMAQLSESSVLPLATGENLFSRQDTANLLRYGGMKPGRDIFQMDAGLSYGLTEYLLMLNLLESAGHNRAQCFPHGGHLINLHIAAGLGLGGCEAYPGVFEPFGGFGEACAINNGKVYLPDAPGFGLEQKASLAPYLAHLNGMY